MANIFSKLISVVGGNIIKDIGDAIDKNVTSTAEKRQLKNELVRIQSEAKLKDKELENQFESEVTKRWEADANSDSALTKSYRPIIALFANGMYFILMAAVLYAAVDNPGLKEVLSVVITPLTTLVATIDVALFGSRGVEKISKNLKLG